MTDFFNKLVEEFRLPLDNSVLVFSLILFIILLAPLLLRKLNIPGIIGLILAGVIVGPYGFHILENNSAIKLFSTIGLLYIMFIAGLELDLNEFKSHKNKSLIFGFFTFIIPLTLGFPACYYILGYDFNASFLTASMFATHTLVAYPIVSRLGIAKNQAVAVTVGGTILTDTAVLLILAIIMGNAQGGLTIDFWIRLVISLTLFSAIMFFVIPRVAKWFFRKLDHEKHLHYIFALAVVFFAAFLAEVAGVEPIIGAFVAGLALNKLIPHSSALMNRIEFIGNSLFIPFFLISVGMLVNVRVIMSGPMALIIAGVLTVVAVAGKWVAAWVSQRAFKYSGAQRQLIFGLSGAHAAATLAVILVGYQAHIIDDNILNGTVILILVTCVIASFATEKAGLKIKAETKDDTEALIKNSGASQEQILLSIDEISHMERLLEFAILIKDKNSTKPISVLSVVSNDQEAEINILKARNELEAFVSHASATETKMDVLTTIDHNQGNGIARISREIMADLVILDWREQSTTDKDIDRKINSTVQPLSKTAFLGHLDKPLPVHSKIVLAVPERAEEEVGFRLWLGKIAKLAQELSIPISLFSNKVTEKAVRDYFAEKKLSAALKTQTFTDWEDFLVLSRHIDKDDLIVLISAKRGALSHNRFLDKIPSKLEKYFSEHSRFIIFPQVEGTSFSEDITEEALNTMQRIGRGLGSIFRR